MPWQMAMIYSLLIHTSPSSRASALAALQFAQALLHAGHQVHRLFFYGDGVLTANGNSLLPQDDHDLHNAWRQLIANHQLDAVVCISAALKRGVLDAPEAQRHQRPAANLSAEYDLSGLGQLMDAAVHSDKLITFG